MTFYFLAYMYFPASTKIVTVFEVLSVRPIQNQVHFYSDVNECLTASDNDCSHNANCLNVEGSYNCTCREGFADRSPDARRPGRVCTGKAVALSHPG